MGNLNEINEALSSGSGDWVKLNEAGQEITGHLVEAEVREKMYEGEVVLSKKTKKPRKEWILTLDVSGELKKVTAAEGGQIAIRKATDELGRKLETGDLVRIVVTKSSVRGKSGPEWDVGISKGSAPKVAAVEEDDAPPF